MSSSNSFGVLIGLFMLLSGIGTVLYLGATQSPLARAVRLRSGATCLAGALLAWVNGGLGWLGLGSGSQSGTTRVVTLAIVSLLVIGTLLHQRADGRRAALNAGG